jgi:phosphoenolpyruvate-protein phosphotransferase (PTS system enzyme I)
MNSLETADPTASGAGGTPGPVLRGVAIAPGLVVGPAHRKTGDLERATTQRVGRGEVADELNRFRAALERSRRQLEELREHLSGKVSVDDARVLDTHLAYLRDS